MEDHGLQNSLLSLYMQTIRCFQECNRMMMQQLHCKLWFPLGTNLDMLVHIDAPFHDASKMANKYDAFHQFRTHERASVCTDQGGRSPLFKHFKYHGRNDHACKVMKILVVRCLTKKVTRRNGIEVLWRKVYKMKHRNKFIVLCLTDLLYMEVVGYFPSPRFGMFR